MRTGTKRAIRVFTNLPSWLRGCLVGGSLGSLAFLSFVALFSLTPLHLLVAFLAAWGGSGAETFRALALPAALLGAWTGGLFGMVIGAVAARISKGAAPRQAMAFPGWFTGALIALYLFLPTFADPTSRFAGRPLATRVIVAAILLGLGALIGHGCAALNRRMRRTT
jgi:hypothetical protein